MVAQVTALQACVDLLIAQGADTRRLAFVGHDFGAMYGTLLINRDQRPTAHVLMAATARFGDWFARYWELGQSEAEYNLSMGDLDPVTNVSDNRTAALYFQFGRSDKFVSVNVATDFYAAASGPKTAHWYRADHALNAIAQRDRTEWLSGRLGIASVLSAGQAKP